MLFLEIKTDFCSRLQVSKILFFRYEPSVPTWNYFVPKFWLFHTRAFLCLPSWSGRVQLENGAVMYFCAPVSLATFELKSADMLDLFIYLYGLLPDHCQSSVIKPHPHSQINSIYSALFSHEHIKPLQHPEQKKTHLVQKT